RRGHERPAQGIGRRRLAARTATWARASGPGRKGPRRRPRRSGRAVPPPRRCTRRPRPPAERAGSERVLAGVLEVPAEPSADPAALSARISDPERVARSLAELSRSGIDVAEFALGQPSLDEAFLALTGHAAEETPEEDAACMPRTRGR